MKYKCKQDIILFDLTLAKKGDLVEKDQVLECGSVYIKLTEDFISNEDLFEQHSLVQVNTKEFQQATEEIEKEWIVEIKVKTSRSNLRKIEEIVQKEISKILWN